jgi:hypothetical protein
MKMTDHENQQFEPANNYEQVIGAGLRKKLSFLQSHGFKLDDAARCAEKHGFKFSYSVIDVQTWNCVFDTVAILGDAPGDVA